MTEDSSRLNVLVVDDEKIIADTLALILNRNGFSATPAYSGEQAVLLARGNHLDVLITDVVMPGIDGIETALRVREEAPKCRVILFSGQGASVHMCDRARSMGLPFDMLVKPIHPNALLTHLRGISSDASAQDSSNGALDPNHRREQRPSGS